VNADRLVAGRRPRPLTAAECAERLRRELEKYGVTAEVHAGFGLALVSVWADLVVWTDGRWFRWRSGRISINGRPVYAFAPASDVVTAARRVAQRYGQLRQQYPPPPWLAEGSS
jgi:hypothetical protein